MSSRLNSSSGMPIWLPIAGVIIAVLVFALVFVRSSNPRGTVAVRAPAGASPVSGPDEGTIRPEKR